MVVASLYRALLICLNNSRGGRGGGLRQLLHTLSFNPLEDKFILSHECSDEEYSHLVD